MAEQRKSAIEAAADWMLAQPFGDMSNADFGAATRSLSELITAARADAECERDEATAQANQSMALLEETQAQSETCETALCNLMMVLYRVSLARVDMPAHLAFELSDAMKVAKAAIQRVGADDATSGDVP